MTPALWHFASLSEEQQAQVVRRLAACGNDEARISALTGIGTEQVRRILSEDLERDT